MQDIMVGFLRTSVIVLDGRFDTYGRIIQYTHTRSYHHYENCVYHLPPNPSVALNPIVLNFSLIVAASVPPKVRL